MDKRIIYKTTDEDGVSTVHVIIPNLACGLTIAEIAAKDVPTGLAFKIVNVEDIPTDRSERDLWDVDDADLTDGVGADYGAGSANDVVGWGEDGEPVTVEVPQ